MKVGKTVACASEEPAIIVCIGSAGDPRLRFDRTALGFVGRLQQSLAASVPSGKTAVVTCTAPIRQDSKTSKSLEAELAQLFKSRKTRLEAKILGNRIQARLIKGGGHQRLIGFVHNPEPDPEVLFEITRAVLRALGSLSPDPQGARVLVFRCQGGRVPIEALRHVCEALRAGDQFRRILVAEKDDLIPLGLSRRASA